MKCAPTVYRALLLAAFVAAPISAQSRAARPIVIQGAMPIEVESLVKRLDRPVEERVGGWTFWTGTVNGYPVVVSETLKGTASAAAATALAEERYHPIAIVNQGTAGGHDPSLHVSDIVIGTSALNIGAFRTTVMRAGAGSNALSWTPLDLTASAGSASANPSLGKLARFDADPQLLGIARRVKASYTRSRVIEGVIGSSDVWNDELDRIAWFHQQFGTEIEEMETASAAQIARLFNVPFLGIRVVSDNATNGGAYDPKTADASEDFVFEVVKAYVATLKR